MSSVQSPDHLVTGLFALGAEVQEHPSSWLMLLLVFIPKDMGHASRQEVTFLLLSVQPVVADGGLSGDTAQLHQVSACCT